MKHALAGYERRELDIRTREATAPLQEALRGQNPIQQLDTQRVIEWRRGEAASALKADPEFQADKEKLTQEMADRYEAMLNRHYDHQSKLMKAHGFETAPDQAKDRHANALLSMAAILSETRQDLERIEEMDREDDRNYRPIRLADEEPEHDQRVKIAAEQDNEKQKEGPQREAANLDRQPSHLERLRAEAAKEEQREEDNQRVQEMERARDR